MICMGVLIQNARCGDYGGDIHVQSIVLAGPDLQLSPKNLSSHECIYYSAQ